MNYYVVAFYLIVKLDKLEVVVLKSHNFYDNLLNHIMKIYPLLHSK